MNNKSKLLSILRKYLGNRKIANLLNNSNSDLYEAYIFSIVLQVQWHSEFGHLVRGDIITS